MHLLAARPGAIDDGARAIDLAQGPAEIVVISAADTDLALLAAAREPGMPSLRLANLMRLTHPYSVDLYVDQVIAKARLVAVRMFGGAAYWPYGIERLAAIAREKEIALALLAGEDRADPELAERSTLPAAEIERLRSYLVEGGPANARAFLRRLRGLLGEKIDAPAPAPLPRAGAFLPRRGALALGEIARGFASERAKAAIVVYRSLVQADDTQAIAALIDALDERGLDVLPLFVASLKDAGAIAQLRAILAAHRPAIILNATGFALAPADDPLGELGVPVLQVAQSSEDERTWREGTRGLSPRDLAMGVALPEMDGRVFAGAIGFKGLRRHDEACQVDIIGCLPEAEQVAHVAALAANWVRLARTPVATRRVALVLANYPHRDGRIGNGVGLDTPASLATIVEAMTEHGYRCEGAPPEGSAWMARLTAGTTNAHGGDGETLSIDAYRHFLASLAPAIQERIAARWGEPEDDPFHDAGRGAFVLPVHRFGHLAVAIQPARGYNLDPAGSYHDPALPPPHGYLATYAYLRDAFDAHAIVHLGKHGNLEWLPGKALALSRACFPRAVLGALPQFYPFIVNDPGEGTQAKRRTSAVIVDHLTPPLTRAGSYGAQAALERLIDEYHEAATHDPRRLAPLARDIIGLAASAGIDRDCAISPTTPTEEALARLDAFLCALKDLQIRDGLHVFGRAPTGARRDALALAIARAPRGGGAGDQSLLRALASDLALTFDPLSASQADRLAHPLPAALGAAKARIVGDAVDALEALAGELIAGRREADAAWTRTRAVLESLRDRLLPAIDGCGPAEIAALLAGLNGRAIAPGPSGAPTRGRPDALPTGRNFHSVDPRALPTPASWELGWRSAGLVLARHLQDHGEYPRAIALSAWGTSAMRTGGDDIAQALALLGVRPRWDDGSRRVAGFEIMPASVLDRPRVDVTLRVSGFFRDAFHNLIDLFDSACRAIAELDEPEAINPLAARVRRDTVEGGNPLAAASRVFGAKPGAYGAGLQALIDEGGWSGSDDLARAYVAWGGFVYGHGQAGASDAALFEHRLSRIDAVLHNQDNREHDLLDSDDYYQFMGGLAAAVTRARGTPPALYHADHARPDAPVVRALGQEIARIVRGRAAHPKWIAGVMRHGYKGAFEMAATVDYLFAFAATTGAVTDDHFDALFKAYLDDPAVRAFIAEANPAALGEMEDRFAEAIERGLWRPRANHVHQALERRAS